MTEEQVRLIVDALFSIEKQLGGIESNLDVMIHQIEKLR